MATEPKAGNALLSSQEVSPQTREREGTTSSEGSNSMPTALKTQQEGFGVQFGRQTSGLLASQPG